MSVQTRSQKKAEMSVVVKKAKVPVVPNEVEKPFAGKEYDEAAARRESYRASNASTPIHKVVTAEKLAELGLTPDSRDPSGRYKIVVSSYKLGVDYSGKKEKWAIAPAGYCWHECSDSDYYNYEWHALCKIPTIYK